MILTLAMCRTIFKVSSLQMRALRNRSFLSDMVLPSLSIGCRQYVYDGCSLSKCLAMNELCVPYAIRPCIPKYFCHNRLVSCFHPLWKIPVQCVDRFGYFRIHSGCASESFVIVSTSSMNKPECAIILAFFLLS